MVVSNHPKAQLSAAPTKKARKQAQKRDIINRSKFKDEQGRQWRRMPDGQILPEEYAFLTAAALPKVTRVCISSQLHHSFGLESFREAGQTA